MAMQSDRMVNGIKTRVLHGKDYVEVSERIHQVYEQKRVLIILQSEPVEVAGRWLWRAVITVDGNQFIGNAEIKFDAPKNSPDGTNPFECAETSAMGRALAWAGLGSVESIASFDEVARSQPYTIAPVAQSVVEATPVRIAAPASAHQSADPAAVDRVRALVGRTFAFKDADFEARWAAYKQHVIGSATADPDLGDAELLRLRQYAEQNGAKMSAAGGGR